MDANAAILSKKVQFQYLKMKSQNWFYATKANLVQSDTYTIVLINNSNPKFQKP
jgi:hypothetical protein